MTGVRLPKPPSAAVSVLPFGSSHSRRSARPNKSGVVCFHPDALRPPFDVIEELTDNRDAYTVPMGENSTFLSMLDFPGYMRTAIDKVRIRVNPKPGVHVTIACCISWGLQVISDHPDVVELLRIKDNFDKGDWANGDAEELVATWYRTFSMGMKSPDEDRSGRQNVRLPLAIHTGVTELASDIGVAAHSLGVLCAMTALSIQLSTNPDVRDQMDDRLAKFFRRVELRVRGTKALIGELLTPRKKR